MKQWLYLGVHKVVLTSKNITFISTLGYFPSLYGLQMHYILLYIFMYYSFLRL